MDCRLRNIYVYSASPNRVCPYAVVSLTTYYHYLPLRYQCYTFNVPVVPCTLHKPKVADILYITINGVYVV